ncbi:MAG: glutathione peroxidase [Deltaproteobacteria bacterium]|jgi:glutathione peroxidase|nr:glutathione peroxidase [Deltaproteobacteria bacterium]
MHGFRLAPLWLLPSLLLASAPARGADPGLPSPLAIEVTRIDGTPEPLSTYRGKVLMLVNVASRCGYTPQYEGLEGLFERYRDRGFAVLGFPSNDFGGQEPDDNEKIAEFCRATWGVAFPMFEKLHVAGPDQHPLYALLTGLPKPLGGPIEWNFQKFLVARDGQVADRIAPQIPPTDPSVIQKIELLLSEARPE